MKEFCRFFVVHVAALAMFSPVSGCGSVSKTKRIVQGEVTYQDQPVAQGRLLLLPEPDTNAPTSGANISDGKFRIDARDGVMLGTYKVEIFAYNPNAASAAGPGDSNYVGELEQYLPARFNSESELQLTVEPGSGPQSHDFALK